MDEVDDRTKQQQNNQQQNAQNDTNVVELKEKLMHNRLNTVMMTLKWFLAKNKMLVVGQEEWIFCGPGTLHAFPMSLSYRTALGSVYSFSFGLLPIERQLATCAGAVYIAVAPSNQTEVVDFMFVFIHRPRKVTNKVLKWKTTKGLAPTISSDASYMGFIMINTAIGRFLGLQTCIHHIVVTFSIDCYWPFIYLLNRRHGHFEWHLIKPISYLCNPKEKEECCSSQIEKISSY